MRFEDTWNEWKKGCLTQEEAGRILGMSERTFRRFVRRVGQIPPEAGAKVNKIPIFHCREKRSYSPDKQTFPKVLRVWRSSSCRAGSPKFWY